MKRRYTIVWNRVGEREIFTCRGLTARVLMARIFSAIRNNPSGIMILSITPERD